MEDELPTIQFVSRLAEYPGMQTAQDAYTRIKGCNSWVEGSLGCAENSLLNILEWSRLGSVGNAVLDKVDHNLQWGEQTLATPANVALGYTESALHYLLPLPTDEEAHENSALFRETLVRAIKQLQSIPERWVTNHPNSKEFVYQISRICEYLYFAAERVGLRVAAAPSASAKVAGKVVDDSISSLKIVEGEVASRIVGFTAAVAHSLYALEQLIASQVASTTNQVLAVVDPYTPATVKNIIDYTRTLSSTLYQTYASGQVEETYSHLTQNFEEHVKHYASRVADMTPEGRKESLVKLRRDAAKTLSALIAVVHATVPRSMHNQIPTTWLTQLDEAAKEEARKREEQVNHDKQEREGEEAKEQKEKRVDLRREERDEREEALGNQLRTAASQVGGLIRDAAILLASEVESSLADRTRPVEAKRAESKAKKEQKAEQKDDQKEEKKEQQKEQPRKEQQKKEQQQKEQQQKEQLRKEQQKKEQLKEQQKKEQQKEQQQKEQQQKEQQKEQQKKEQQQKEQLKEQQKKEQQKKEQQKKEQQKKEQQKKEQQKKEQQKKEQQKKEQQKKEQQKKEQQKKEQLKEQQKKEQQKKEQLKEQQQKEQQQKEQQQKEQQQKEQQQKEALKQKEQKQQKLGKKREDLGQQSEEEEKEVGKGEREGSEKETSEEGNGEKQDSKEEPGPLANASFPPLLPELEEFERENKEKNASEEVETGSEGEESRSKSGSGQLADTSFPPLELPALADGVEIHSDTL